MSQANSNVLHNVMHLITGGVKPAAPLSTGGAPVLPAAASAGLLARTGRVQPPLSPMHVPPLVTVIPAAPKKMPPTAPAAPTVTASKRKRESKPPKPYAYDTEHMPKIKLKRRKMADGHFDDEDDDGIGSASESIRSSDASPGSMSSSALLQDYMETKQSGEIVGDFGDDDPDFHMDDAEDDDDDEDDDGGEDASSVGDASPASPAGLNAEKAIQRYMAKMARKGMDMAGLVLTKVAPPAVVIEKKHKPPASPVAPVAVLMSDDGDVSEIAPDLMDVDAADEAADEDAKWLDNLEPEPARPAQVRVTTQDAYAALIAGPPAVQYLPTEGTCVPANAAQEKQLVDDQNILMQEHIRLGVSDNTQEKSWLLRLRRSEPLAAGTVAKVQTNRDQFEAFVRGIALRNLAQPLPVEFM